MWDTLSPNKNSLDLRADSILSHYSTEEYLMCTKNQTKFRVSLLRMDGQSIGPSAGTGNFDKDTSLLSGLTGGVRKVKGEPVPAIKPGDLLRVCSKPGLPREVSGDWRVQEVRSEGVYLLQKV